MLHKPCRAPRVFREIEKAGYRSQGDRPLLPLSCCCGRLRCRKEECLHTIAGVSDIQAPVPEEHHLNEVPSVGVTATYALGSLDHTINAPRKPLLILL